MSIGDKIKLKRKELKISATRMAEMLDIPVDRIYKWEKGAKPSLYEDYEKINNFLYGIDVKTETKIEDRGGDDMFTYEELVHMHRNNILLIKDLREKLSKIEKSTGHDIDKKTA